jgi:hypothetical protein
MVSGLPWSIGFERAGFQAWLSLLVRPARQMRRGRWINVHGRQGMTNFKKNYKNILGYALILVMMIAAATRYWLDIPNDRFSRKQIS